MPRIAIVRKDRCNPVGCGGYLCAKLCPVNMEGEDCIVPGPPPDKKPVIDEGLCTGCGICPNRCPFDAIDIVNLPAELENPLHRYGRNGFHLYSAPVPVFGRVAGVVGRNGVGKSTALKILSGSLQPNLGSDAPASVKEIMKFFRGGDVQKFFEGDRKIAYKPQHVELIAKMLDGTVEGVLKKVDERGAFDEVVDALELRGVLDRDVKQLSGGELQRMAIAAAALRDADVYVVDEPSAYLDIKQRINISRFLRGLPGEKASVLVVEHDLIILDFMTDLLHIMYGKPGSYGVTSLPKSTRGGMNTYLSGFIREENMRFRDHEIRFERRALPKTVSQEKIVEWPAFEKTLGSFKLSADGGWIGRSEIVGVLGENGSGKTTFVKVLAGVEKPDRGKVDVGVRVSYKPQYIECDSDELVADFLADAVKRFEVELIRPLEVTHLLQNPLNTLSGGELQRVAIAKCLSADADVFLLDEPSAYLDVEQRLAFGKIIKNFAELRDVSILVVDHDLLFIDSLADRLIIFGGVPAKTGLMAGPFRMEEGMNRFLKRLGITMRRDVESNRPRINNPGSSLDREQRASGKLYYS